MTDMGLSGVNGQNSGSCKRKQEERRGKNKALSFRPVRQLDKSRKEKLAALALIG